MCYNNEALTEQKVSLCIEVNWNQRLPAESLMVLKWHLKKENNRIIFLKMNTVCLQQFSLTVPLSPLQSTQSGSAQRAPARGGASSWRRPNLQGADVTICVKPTTAAALTSTSIAWKQVSLMSQSLHLVLPSLTCYSPTRRLCFLTWFVV